MEKAERALFVTPWLPVETDWTRSTGIAKRQHMLVDALAQVADIIDVLVYVSDKRFDGSAAQRVRIEAELGDFWGVRLNVTLCRWRATPADASAWSHYVAPAIDFFHHRHLWKMAGPEQAEALAQCLARRPALAVFHRLQCVMPALSRTQALPVSFMDLDDVEHVSFRRGIHEPPVWPGKYFDYLQIPALMAAERRAIALMRDSFVCSEPDSRHLRRLFRTDKVTALPNAVPHRDATPPSAAPTLLLLGHYSFTPNRLGAEYLLESVWPRVLARRPDARLVVAGAGPEAIRRPASPPDLSASVRFPGYVDDIDAVYAEARAVVCPILSGAGTRLKVLEAAAYGRPIVSTTIGAEGIALDDGSEILLADTPDAFADACVRLLDEPALAARLGAAARAKVDALYGRGQVVDRLAGIFRAGLATRSAA